MSNGIKDLYDYDLVKKCSNCGIIKLKSNFYKDKTKNDGLHNHCIFCRKKYYLDNQHQIPNYNTIYKGENRSKINSYEQNKRNNDFNFKLSHNIRVRTRQAFISQNIKKLNKTFDLLGCSQSFLRKWILYQLHANMTEENYGSVWTIDHCYPLSKTNLSNEIDIFKSSHWINLRPMYIKDNISKGSKIDNRLYLMQEVKAKYFLKLNNDQERLN